MSAVTLIGSAGSVRYPNGGSKVFCVKVSDSFGGP